MKNVVIAVMMVGVMGCGKESSSDGSKESAEEKSNRGAMMIATADDLPKCSSSSEGQLIYIKADQEFKVCQSGEWDDIDVRGKDGTSVAGKDGADGHRIVSNKLIDPYSPDLCTGVADEVCYFGGGQLIKYSDGAILLSGYFRYGYFVAGDTDIDTTGATYHFPPDVAEGYIRLTTTVHRGVDYRALFLSYTSSGDVLKLVYDSDGDGFESTDPVISTLTVSDW